MMKIQDFKKIESKFRELSYTITADIDMAPKRA